MNNTKGGAKMRSNFKKRIHTSTCIDQSFYNPKDNHLILKFSKSKSYYSFKNVQEKCLKKIFSKGSIGQNFLKSKLAKKGRSKKINETDLLRILF